MRPHFPSTAWVAVALALASPSARADRAKLLIRDDEAALARIALTNDVRSEVNAAYYIFDEDETSLLFLARMRDLAANGKSVRLLVDHLSQRVGKGMISYLIKSGVQLRFYHPHGLIDAGQGARGFVGRLRNLTANSGAILRDTLTRPPAWIYRRMHDKQIIVDSGKTISGSRNVTNSAFSWKRLPRDVKLLDVDVYVEGDSVKDANRYFMSLWNSDEVAPPAYLGGVKPDEEGRAKAALDHYSRILARWNAQPGMRARIAAATADAVEVGAARFFHDPVGAKGRQPGTREAQLAILRDAKPGSRVLIENPYVLLTRDFKDAIRDAAGRGVRIELMTNARYEGTAWIVGTQYEKERGDLVRLGYTQGGAKVHLWEKLRPGFIHAKVASDGENVAVTTFNLDPRSSKINTEIGWSFRSPELARQLETEFEDLKRQSRYSVGEGPPPAGSVRRACAKGLLRMLSGLLRPQL